MIKKALHAVFVLLIIFFGRINAQPFALKSKGEAKEFKLKIYFGTQGKGAFVQYAGQKGIIPLIIKSHTTDETEKSNGQPKFDHYVWEEIVEGNVNGTYELTQSLRSVSDIKYTRNKDNRVFNLELDENKNEKYDGNDKLLLHGILISFNHFSDNNLNFLYPDNTRKNVTLPDVDMLDFARQSIIEDYNFDGYDDIAFSVPDGGQGVYRIFDIWLYNPAANRFYELKEPDYSKANCSCLCDVSLDKSKKILKTGCRGAARWWEDLYKYNKKGNLFRIGSRESTYDF